jgi:hypothetical protein
MSVKKIIVLMNANPSYHPYCIPIEVIREICQFYPYTVALSGFDHQLVLSAGVPRIQFKLNGKRKRLRLNKMCSSHIDFLFQWYLVRVPYTDCLARLDVETCQLPANVPSSWAMAQNALLLSFAFLK